ncbi:response regulator [Nocardia brasiliensis]|uniref:response regulator n=1 Tax=Nocardia brasiliensis TaxID=37326 RepID=UPI00378AFC0D
MSRSPPGYSSPRRGLAEPQPIGGTPPPIGWNIRAGRPVSRLRATPPGAGRATWADAGVLVIRVAVVDDEALVRAGFALILGATDDIEVVLTSSGVAAMDAIRAAAPQVVLLDIRMPEVDGLHLLSRLIGVPDPPAVAMLTTFAADDYIADALRRGASGFILKDTDPLRLVAMVRVLAAGGVVLSPAVTEVVVERYLAAAAAVAPETVRLLTDRERDIVVLIAAGLSNADIGARLHLSIGTVKDAMRIIFGKLQVRTRVQAALIAERAGLVPADLSRWRPAAQQSGPQV